MKISIRQKLLLFTFIILAGIGLIGYGGYESNQKLHDSVQWVEHTEQVIYQSGNILLLAIDMETASRGFVITNDSTFLEPLFMAEKASFENIRQLRQLTQDNPMQQQRVDSINFYMTGRLAFSLKSVELRHKEGLASAVAYISGGEGKQFSNRLRQLTDAIQKEEGNLLKERKLTNLRSEAAFNRISVILFILMVVFIILLVIAIGKYLAQNKEKGKRADELIIANKELHFQKGEKIKRADELIAANKELVFQNEKKEKRAAELIIANRDLEISEEQFKEVNNELESFSYSVSHDLRAPLRAVNGYTQMLKQYYEPQLDPEAKRLMNSIMNNAKKMGQLIDDLLSFSRLGRRELVKMNIPVFEMVTAICNELKNEQDGRKIDFDIKQLLPARADNIALKQVWINLISNAIKYSKLKEKTIIEIGSEIKGDEIIYYIKDNGAGFDMRYAGKLFNIFQRLHTDEEFEGTGVGLAIIQRIISKHGGRVWAEGKVNEGAVFYFTLNKS
jgi:signal transduction histidine kinase